MFRVTCVKILSISLLVASTVRAQQNVTLESIIPPAPNANELGKYGSYPVGMLTGLPEISFPLYEINTGKLKLPVTLSYHASGIKVGQKSTDVGLGWSVMAGGSISRSVFGTPDDWQYGYFNYTPPTFLELASIKSYLSLLSYTSNPGYDLEPDLFVYNVAGRSGKFICRKNKEFMTIPFDPIKVQKAPFENTVIFQIVDDNGTIYQFDQYSYTISEFGSNNPGIRQTVSTWYLTKMISADQSDEITFEYENIPVADAIAQHLYPLGRMYNLTNGCSGTAVQYDFVSGPLSTGFTSLNYGELLVKKITFRNGTIQFNRNTLREDVFLTGKSLDEIVVLNNNNQIIRKITFDHDYYRKDPSAADVQNKRLKLTGFVISDENKLINNQYQFDYESTPLPRTNEFSQDYWGYYNGQNNQNLIPQTKVYASDIGMIQFGDGLTYSANNGYAPTTNWVIGNANREPSAGYMQAGILNKITYPTGGYSLFEYEPHKYNSDTYITQPVTKGGIVVGNTPTQKSESIYAFSYPSQSTATNLGSVNASLYVNFSASNMNNAIVDDPQIVTLTDLTANTVQTWKHEGDITVAQTLNLVYTLDPGHSYELKLVNYGYNNTHVESQISWTENTSQTLVRIGGGLRIKSIKNFDYTGHQVKEENYAYGLNEDGLGIKLFDERHFYKNYSDVCYEFYNGNSLSCICVGEAAQRQYLGLSQYSSLSYLGSPVLYSKVAKYEGSISNNIGKTVYSYNVQVIPSALPDYFVNSGNYGAVNNAWNNGELNDITVYKKENNQYYPVSKDVFEYTWYNLSEEKGILAKQYKFITSQNCFSGGSSSEGSAGLNTYGDRPWLAHFTGYEYSIKTGASRKTKETKTVYAQAGSGSLQTVTTTQFLNPGHLYPNVVSTTLSDGSQKIIKYFYPPDLSTSPTDMYGRLSQKNMLSIPARTESYLGSTSLQSMQTNFNEFNSNANLLFPASSSVFDKGGNAVQTLTYRIYDQYGNALEKEMDGNIISDLYDYKSMLPVCEVKNATYANIAYTSFEADGTGNWIIGSNQYGAGGITGNKCYQLSNGAITKTGLTASTTYIVSYWTLNSTTAFTINGTQGTPVKGKTVNGWTYFEHKVNGVIQVELPQVYGLIDELRLYPAHAQMTTTTYTPLVGMTAQCTPDSQITYYEYDELGRLKLVKDQNGNIIKSMEYHYHGQ